MAALYIYLSSENPYRGRDDLWFSYGFNLIIYYYFEVEGLGSFPSFVNGGFSKVLPLDLLRKSIFRIDIAFFLYGLLWGVLPLLIVLVAAQLACGHELLQINSPSAWTSFEVSELVAVALTH